MPFATVGPVSLHYEFAGEGPPLVLIPGWTLNTRLWDIVLPALRKGHAVLRYDVRGAGRSASDPSLEYSRVADAEDLEGLLDLLGLQKVHLVGHSKGARIAFVFAMSRPERVLSLTAVGSAEPQPPPGGSASFRAVTDAWVARCREVARTDGVPEAVRQLSSARLFGKLRASPEGMRRLRRAMVGYAAADLLSDTPKRAFDTSAAMSRLTMPVQIVVGDQDPFLAECTYAAQVIPGARLTILKRCGHVPPIECPEGLSEAICGWTGGPMAPASDAASSRDPGKFL